MEEKYTLVPDTSVRPIIIPYIHQNGELNKSYAPVVYSYFCEFRTDPFDGDMMEVTLNIYTGTKLYSRRATQQYESIITTISFYVQNQEEKKNEKDGLNYILFLKRLTKEKLLEMDYTIIPNRVFYSETIEDVEERFGRYAYIQQ